MRLLPVSRLRDGMELAQDIPAPYPDGVPLLRAGVSLNATLALGLARRGVRAVWVSDELSEGIEPIPPLPREVRETAQRTVSSALGEARSAIETAQALSDETLAQIARVANEIARAISDCPEAALALDDLASADSYTHAHSVRVATLGVLIGQRVCRQGWRDWRGNIRSDREEERLTTLGMGLLMHDIGKVVIPSEILNKPGAFTPEEFELVKSHAEAGASLLPPDRVSPLAIAVVRDHHERWDGRGYSRGLVGEQTHQFARIAAVADVYDAITADRPYASAAPPHVGVRTVEDGAGGQFDPAIVEHFRRVVMPYPLGHEIRLPDGRAAVVAHVDPGAPDRLTVRVKENGAVVEYVADMSSGEVAALMAA